MKRNVMTKGAGMFYIYYQLRSWGSISKLAIEKELGISDLQFCRYIAALRECFSIFDVKSRIVYRKRSNLYDYISEEYRAR